MVVANHKIKSCVSIEEKWKKIMVINWSEAEGDEWAEKNEVDYDINTPANDIQRVKMEL